MTKPRIQKLHFFLLFFEQQYIAYYNSLRSEIFNTQKKTSDLVNCFSDLLYRAKFLFDEIKYKPGPLYEF